MAEEETMETEEEKEQNAETGETLNNIPETPKTTEERIIQHLLSCEDVFFKSQQRGEKELTLKEKIEIASKIFHQSKSNFLCRFGKHLEDQHLEYFQQFCAADDSDDDAYAISYYLAELRRYFTKSKREKDVRNRRYDALKKLLEESNYFEETEMMRRNPLLYHQLVGQYLSEEEKKKRDNIDTKNITFVNLLLESIDRDCLRKKQKEQRDLEDSTMEEEEEDTENEVESAKKIDDSDSWDEEPTDKITKWGEFPGSSTSSASTLPEQTRRYDQIFKDDGPQQEVVMISATERKILKEEFISIMYQNFLDGKDVDFDYGSVDDNEVYDNLELKTHDAEDSYFDSETPEDVPLEEDDAVRDEEDELDVFMSRLKQHPTVQQLSEQMNNL